MRREVKAALLNDEAMGQLLRGLRPRVPPAGLTTSLRVLASREVRRRTGAEWRDRLHMFAHNLMRPLALPFAGGVCSTIVLFSMWLTPTYPVHAQGSFDVPTVLSTEATVKGTGVVGGNDAEVVVEVIINGEGRMVDYTIVSGRSTFNNETSRRNLENFLLFTEFTPATSFGQPMSGRMRLSLQPSHIDVKG
jgi:hypothetical protein